MAQLKAFLNVSKEGLRWVFEGLRQKTDRGDLLKLSILH
jgi:hypothetical protein